MHIPDGFLDAKTTLAAGVLAAGALGVALRRARRELPPQRVPLLGLAAAFVFAAQMLNFPVLGGTSGHLIGAVLTAALLGPSASVIVISSVLIVQCFLFADGGIAALGANIFNMAVVGGVGGWALCRAIEKVGRGRGMRIAAAGIAAWFGTVLASIACAGELAASKTIEWRVVFPAMAGVHMLIGVGEGVITMLVLSAIAASRPDLIGESTIGSRAGEKRPGAEGLGSLLTFGLIISMGLALFVAPFASPWPDGLDKSAESLGFADRETSERSIPTLIPSYKMPGIASEGLATGVAGVAGTTVVFVLSWIGARALVRRKRGALSADAAAS